MIEVSVETLGVDPADCVVIGDNPETNVEMGRRAGMGTVLGLTGLVDRADPLVTEGPADQVRESIADLPDIIGSRPD